MVEQIENIAQLTECIVCREQYDFQQRAPKILNCGHNICKLCFKKSYKQQQLKKKGIKCPICRKQDMRNKKSIQNDIQLMKIMQMQASQINNYEICQKHNEQYEIFCLECKIKMCIICGEEHRQTNHDVVDLEITYNYLLKISQELKQWHLGKISNVNMKYQELNEQTINLKIKFSEFESFVQDATDALIIMLQNHKKQKIKYAQEKYDEVMSSLQKQREEIANKQLKLLENVSIPDLKTELSESHQQRLKEIEELIEYNKQVKDLQKFNFQSFQFLNINIIKTPFDVTPIANYSNFQELYDEFIWSKFDVKFSFSDMQTGSWNQDYSQNSKIKMQEVQSNTELLNEQDTYKYEQNQKVNENIFIENSTNQNSIIINRYQSIQALEFRCQLEKPEAIVFNLNVDSKLKAILIASPMDNFSFISNIKVYQGETDQDQVIYEHQEKIFFRQSEIRPMQIDLYKQISLQAMRNYAIVVYMRGIFMQLQGSIQIVNQQHLQVQFSNFLFCNSENQGGENSIEKGPILGIVLNNE